MNIDVDDYQHYAEQSRRRFRVVVVSLLIGLMAAIYVPWALVSTHTLSSSVAAPISVIAAIVLMGAWQALLTRLSNPNDSAEPTEASRSVALRSLLATAGAILALLVTSAGASHFA